MKICCKVMIRWNLPSLLFQGTQWKILVKRLYPKDLVRVNNNFRGFSCWYVATENKVIHITTQSWVSGQGTVSVTHLLHNEIHDVRYHNYLVFCSSQSLNLCNLDCVIAHKLFSQPCCNSHFLFHLLQSLSVDYREKFDQTTCYTKRSSNYYMLNNDMWASI